MAYKIDARLERGAPSLTLIDVVTGEVKLHWRGDRLANGERDWSGLFKRLMLLCCADQFGLGQCVKLPIVGEPCIERLGCVDQHEQIKIQTAVFATDKERAEC